MLDGYFSKRYKLRPQSCGFTYEFVPESARASLCQILDNYFQDGSLNANQLYFNISRVFSIPKGKASGKTTDLPKNTRKAVGDLIMECEWWQFYDICEIVPRSLNAFFSKIVKADFYEKVNILLKTEKLGFEITADGLVEKADTSFTDAMFKKVRYLLRDSEFNEANELFEGALQETYSKSQPDHRKCIDAALSAVEAVIRRVNNDDKKLSSFNEIVNDMTEKGIIPRQIDRVIRNIYISIGDHQRGTYGLNGFIEIGIDEAEFVLATTAAIINYLVSKNRQLEKAPYLNGRESSLSLSQQFESEVFLRK